MTGRPDELADAYTRCRARLVRVAYALLGTRAEAEDVVSDCWLRLAAADRRERVEDVEAWATVTVARAALDVLRSARRRRETYVGPWLPEPVVEWPEPGAEDPAERAALHESVGFAVLVVLETLTPAERTAWALHDLFGVPHGEVARIVGRSPAAVRQLVMRARAHVSAGAPRVEVAPGQHRRAVAAFTRAAAEGDLGGLLRVLDPSIVITSDGGGLVSAARRPVRGPGNAARFLIGVARRLRPGLRLLPVSVNGGPGFAVMHDDAYDVVCSLTFRGALISRVDLVLTPEKLPRQGAAP